jgi:hypothetical protein
MSADAVYQRPRFWAALIGSGFFLFFEIAFRDELNLFLHWVGIALKALFSQSPYWLLNDDVRNFIWETIRSAFDDPTKRAFFILLVNAFVFLASFSPLLFWVGGFILPVQSFKEQALAFRRILRYLFGGHGPAIFVREGKLRASEAELEKSQPGVALVDLSSALVLESQSWETAQTGDEDDERREKKKARLGIFSSKKTHDTSVLMRVEGPGLVFTDEGEKVKDTVDLRKQTRAQLNVKGYTRDGIEIETKISTVFSLSDPPEVILVTYAGGKKAENLRAVSIEKVPALPVKMVDKNAPEAAENPENESPLPEETAPVECVKALYELNALEQNEIHSRLSGRVAASEPAVSPKKPGEKYFYPFDPERIALAVYNQPSMLGVDASVHWTDLPCMIAVEIFRNMLTQFTFDDLYKRDDPDEQNFLLKDFKREFSFRVRSRGLVSYQFVERPDGNIVRVGDRKEDLFVLPETRNLKAPAELRNCGIRVVAGSFSELKPVKKEVEQELINNWKAKWEKDVASTLAERDLEAARVRNRARTQVQSGSAHSLSRIFDDTPYTDEAYVVRVFQALEMAATDTKDSNAPRLLPHETINMLWSLYRWLFDNRESSPDDADGRDVHPPAP